MDEIETPNHPDAVCSLHGLPCHELGEVLIERDALRSRLSAIEAAKAGEPPIPVWHEHDRYNYAEPEHRFRARLEDWGREGWDAAAALRVEVEELRHRANGWADIATSGLQWLRNVRDGLSTPQTAIENMEALIADLREGRWRAIPDPAIRAEDLVEALSDEPAASQGEVQP